MDDARSGWALTQRATATQPFLVMEVMERAEELARAGKSIMHLEVGEPDFPTPRLIVEAGMGALAGGETHYTHSMGLLPLRQAICRYYKRQYRVDVTPDRIVVTAGSSMAMLYVFGALIDPGDEVIVGTPHYPCYPNFVRFFGGRLVEVPTDPADGYRLDPDRVREAITPRTRAILLNSPANPTGAVLDADRLRAMAGLGVPIVSDEIYHGLEYGARAHTMLEFAPDAFVLDGFSKRYAMTGWRLGWLVAPAGTIRTFQKLQQNFLISPGAAAQHAGIMALDHCAADVEAMRQVYDQRRKVTVELFRELGFGVSVMPQGAFYAFADASRFTQDSYAFAFELLECAGVGVTPGVDFGEAGRRAIRLSYASSEDSIREAARRIGEYLECRRG